MWGCIYLLELVFLFSSDKYPGVELLDHVVVLFLIFWGIAIMFSIVTASMCIPTNSAQGLPFLTSLPTTVMCCLFDNSHTDRWEVISPGWTAKSFECFLKYASIQLCSSEILSMHVGKRQNYKSCTQVWWRKTMWLFLYMKGTLHIISSDFCVWSEVIFPAFFSSGKCMLLLAIGSQHHLMRQGFDFARLLKTVRNHDYNTRVDRFYISSGLWFNTKMKKRKENGMGELRRYN